MTIITDWGLVWKSRVVEFTLDDDFMGAVDLREEALDPNSRLKLSEDKTALVLPDGRSLSIEHLRERCFDPRPLSGRPLMRAAEFADWADDGSDVRWELQGGIPVPPPPNRMGKLAVKMELAMGLREYIDPIDRSGEIGTERVPRPRHRWQVLMGTWTCQGPDAIDCRTPDVVVFPQRRITIDSLWIKDPIIVGEIEEPSTKWLNERRLAFARKMPTVQEVVTIDWRCRWARIERRTDKGWRVEEVPAGGVLALATIDWSISLADLLARADR
jgi:hypothetical protein